MESFGFPAGKTKAMPVDLTGLVDPKDPRVRIRTTIAIFWDEAFVTVNDPPIEVVTTSLAPSAAVLSERGFPRGYRETPDGPEVLTTATSRLFRAGRTFPVASRASVT